MRAGQYSTENPNARNGWGIFSSLNIFPEERENCKLFADILGGYLGGMDIFGVILALISESKIVRSKYRNLS